MINPWLYLVGSFGAIVLVYLITRLVSKAWYRSMFEEHIRFHNLNRK